MSSFFPGSKDPNRKKGEDYLVSEQSQLAGSDFAYNSTLSSRLYRELKSLQRTACNRSTYRRLQNALYEAVRNDQIHDLGSLRLGYGDVSPLKGFRFSLKTSLSRFLMNNPAASFNEEKKSVEMRIALKDLHSFEAIHARLARLVIKMYCIVIQVDNSNEITMQASRDLELQRDHVRTERTAHFSLKNIEDAVILCLCTVRSWLKSPDGKDEFLSNDSTLMTAEVIDAISVRDGHRVVFSGKKDGDIQPDIQANNDDEVEWS
ncbi:hypothetical protein [Sphingobacterium thalpophilum]|uniref:hypothetical protein n=1 Tax=Sphingobacterium thalpophilum TaxID=259 RepID=UPI002D769496|nr:hypothetical protein [Sphingobacterium thalpophilum]